jgi:hypothetical protein
MCRWSAVERIDKSIGLKFAQETVIKKTPWFLPLHFGIARLELFPARTSLLRLSAASNRIPIDHQKLGLPNPTLS